MLSTLYTHPLSEGFESFHPPSDYRTSRFGHVDIQLTYSRDGQYWRRPADRSPVIPVGEPGDPDDGAVYPAQNPLVVNGETWIYYVATRHRHSWWHVLEQYERDRSVQHVACGMLAKMPEDGWVSLEAGNRGGTFTTQPFGLPHELTLNADATGGSIQVEVVTPYGEVVPGLSRADCRPVTSRSTRHVVQWKGSSDLAARNQEFRGGVLYRFYLENAKVYSFSLAFPDPTGEHERWLANARWLETIKHKSDGFSGRGTEPAGGLPPYTGRAIPWD
jgi:hypothetical protein